MASADEKVKESMDENMSSHVIQCPKGWLPTPGAWPMVEVFSVCIDNIDGGDPCRLYGKITSAGTQGTRHIYHREKDSYETIIPGGTASSLTLTGPIKHSISALEGFSIDVALYDWDREISLGIISCSSNENDRPLSYKVRGKHGCATVNYAVWSEAVQATVDVTLIGGSIDGEEDPPAMVYGDIIACNSKFENHESALFSCKGDEMVKNNVIRPGQPIPLLRSVVAVPLDSTLKIKANLLKKKKDDHNKAALCDIYGEKGKKIRLDNNKAFCAAQDPTNEIANGTAMFRPQLCGTSEEYIYSKEGKNKILLQVTWGEVVQAVVKVKHVKGLRNKDPAKVYGHIIARHNQFKNYERVLFSKKEEDACFMEEEGVRPGEAIPLLRSVVAVPWCPVQGVSILILETNLKHNNNDDFDQPLVIANCAEEYPVAPCISVETLYTGANGMMIRVRVNWENYERTKMKEDVPSPELDYFPLVQYYPQQTSRIPPRSFPEGWELVEVFSVRIDNIERGDPCLLHGKITSVDPSGLEHIYNGKTIIPGGTTSSVWLTLTGPADRAISACGDFTIKVALYDSDDVEICCALIFWHDNCSYNNVYDQLLCSKLIGKHGCCVSVNYSVWRDAAEATVEVILVGEEDLPPQPAKVYGDIIAFNSNFKYYKSVLFSWSEAEMVKNNANIRPGQLIPLLRSIVAVPLGSSLVIKANLKNKDDYTAIANGAAEFPARPDGISEEKYIIGEEGSKHKILLQVTWGEVVKAYVNVTLIQKGGVSGAKVYGKLTASHDIFDNYERVLFNRKKEDDDNGFIEEEVVRPGEPIPLLRSVLAVPSASTLFTIMADLKKDDHTVIASGAAEFPTQAGCTSDGKYIQGENGMAIRVQVTWGRVGGDRREHDGEDSFYSPNVPWVDAQLGALDLLPNDIEEG